jgi:hypothetical protein
MASDCGVPVYDFMYFYRWIPTLKMEASYLSETLLSIDRAIGVSNQKTIV